MQKAGFLIARLIYFIKRILCKCLSRLQAKIFGQSFMMSRLNVAVDDLANAEAEKKAQ